MPYLTETLPELRSEDYNLLYTAMKHGKAHSNHLRVNVVGNQDAGKTTLVKRLQRVLSSCIDNDTQPTEALDIDKTTIRCIQSLDGIVEWQTKQTGKCFGKNK